MSRAGSIYIMTNKIKTTLYIGVTSDLRGRILQHRQHFYKGSFSDKYNLEYCIYYEHYPTIMQAIMRRKKSKNGEGRKKKCSSIHSIHGGRIYGMTLRNGRGFTKGKSIAPVFSTAGRNLRK